MTKTKALKKTNQGKLIGNICLVADVVCALRDAGLLHHVRRILTNPTKLDKRCLIWAKENRKALRDKTWDPSYYD